LPPKLFDFRADFFLGPQDLANVIVDVVAGHNDIYN
jgi:hypothetical protein